MNSEENVMTKLEPRCLCCLSEIAENFSTVDMTRIVQELMHAEVNFNQFFTAIECVLCTFSFISCHTCSSTCHRSFVWIV